MKVNNPLVHLKRIVEAKRIQRFYRLSYQERVGEIKRLYSHTRMKPSFDRYFSTGVLPESYSSPYFDIVAAYARELNAQQALQVGCFTCQDSIFLAHSGFRKRQIATDFDPDRIEYLKLKFAGDPVCRRIEFGCLDLEGANPADFNNVDLVFALAVLSNIQPEGLERLFKTIASSTVKVCVFGDIYRPQTLSRVAAARSVPSSSRNWFHPFLSLAERSGMEALFVPGFSTNDFRGIFVIHKGVPTNVHETAVAHGFGRYVSRQPKIKLDA